MANEVRLIDANELCEFFQERYEYLRSASERQLPNGYVEVDLEIQCGAIIAKEFLDKAKQAPTVNAVEVVHAHWEDGCAMHNGKEVYKSIDCSHCEEVFKIESDTREYWKARFKVCPFCGAVMDGERREGE
jgi:hypothetical protein